MNRDGYSLVELMMVVGIVGVVSASAVPSLMSRKPQREMKQAVWQIYMDLQQAKALSVSESQSVTITVNNAQDQYSIWADSNGNGVRDVGETETVDLSDTPNVDLYAYPETVSFNPSGTVSSSYYYFYMRVMVASSENRYIYVFPNGHIDPMRDQ